MGKHFKACCPFHAEKTPSFSINPERGFAYCFGCHEHGDVIKLYEKLEGVDFKDAVKALADKAGVTLTDSFGGGARKEKKDRLIEINELTASFFQTQLADSEEAKSYVAGRALSTDTLRDWQVGYAPASYDALWPTLLDKGFEKKEVIEAGVAGVKEMGGDDLFDKFRGRVMFPISDHRGKVVAFTGRVLGDGEPKYMNSPESPIFTKGAILFGYPQAKEAIRESGEGIVVEGQMDVLACHQSGFRNVVASSGTALTDMHLSALKKLGETVLLCFDADTAGISSTQRGIELALKQDLTVRVVRLTEGCKDPDEVIQQDSKLLTESFATALPVFDWYFAVVYAAADLNDVSTKKKIAREMLAVARCHASAVEREEFIKQLAIKLGTSEQVLLEEQRHLPRESQPTQTAAERQLPEREHFEHEAILVGLILNTPELRQSIGDWQPQHENYKKILGDEQLSDEIKVQAEKLRLVAEEHYGTFNLPRLTQEVEQLIAGFGKKSHTGQLRELKIKMSEAEAAGDDAAASQLFAEYQALLAK